MPASYAGADCSEAAGRGRDAGGPGRSAASGATRLPDLPGNNSPPLARTNARCRSWLASVVTVAEGLRIGWCEKRCSIVAVSSVPFLGADLLDDGAPEDWPRLLTSGAATQSPRQNAYFRLFCRHRFSRWHETCGLN